MLGAPGADLPGSMPGVQCQEERMVRVHVVAQRHRGRGPTAVSPALSGSQGRSPSPNSPHVESSRSHGDTFATERRHAPSSCNSQVAGPSYVPPAHGCTQAQMPTVACAQPAQHFQAQRRKGPPLLGRPVPRPRGDPTARPKRRTHTPMRPGQPFQLGPQRPYRELSQKEPQRRACASSAPNTPSGSCSSKPIQTDGFTAPLENGVPNPAPWREVHRL